MLANGAGPRSVLIRDALGNLYGTTYSGGAYTYGTVFELTHIAGGGWKETFLYSFTGLTDGSNPSAGLIFGSAGNLYGTTMLGGTSGYGVVFELTPTSNGWNESVLYNFTGGNDGGIPQAGVIQDAAGNLYGATSAAGNSNCYGLIEYAGCGAVFELSPTLSGWNETTLHTFKGGSGDGGVPVGGLILDSAGNLYGATMGGGAINSCDEGCGTVFRLSPTGGAGWRETLLLQFRSATGAWPAAPLALDAEGNLYGTTSGRGDLNANCLNGCGTVFKLAPTSGGGWLASELHVFTGGSDGGEPMAGLVFDSAGNLYGTTTGGGGNFGCYLGCGVVFKLTPGSSGWNETVLHAFDTAQDGANPVAGVLLDELGDVYGTTPSGGNGLPVGRGTVYEIVP